MTTLINVNGDMVKFWTDPYAHHKEYLRNKLKDDPEFKTRFNENCRNYQKKRYAQDQDYRQARLDAVRRCRERKKNSTSKSESSDTKICSGSPD